MRKARLFIAAIPTGRLRVQRPETVLPVREQWVLRVAMSVCWRTRAPSYMNALVGSQRPDTLEGLD